MKEYKEMVFPAAFAVMQAAVLYEKLAVAARAEHMPLSIAAGMAGEMRRKVAADWWGQKAPQEATCPYYEVEDLVSVEDLLTAARVTDDAVAAALEDVSSLFGIRKGIALSSEWVQNVAATPRKGEKFCAACCEYVYDYMAECPCGARGSVFYKEDFC